MSTIYNKLQNDFTIINNHIIQNNKVSGNAFKLYCYIVFRLGRNPEWEFISYEILTHFKEGKKALKTARDELINLGYLKCLGQKHRANGDFGGNDYEIYSTPACYPEGSTLQRQTLEGSTHKGSTNKNEYNKTELKKEINNINPASGFSPSFEKPTVEENLTPQSSISEIPNNLHTQKQNIQTMQFQKFWNLYEKPKKVVNWNAANVKQAEKLFIYALKQCESFEWLMRNTEDYLTVKSTGKHGDGVKRGICSFLSKRDFSYLINWNEKLQEIKGIDPKNTVVNKQDQEKVQEEKQAKKEVNNADYQATTSKLQKLNAEKLCNDIQQSITTSMSDTHKHWYDFKVLDIFEKNDSIFLGIQTKSEPNQAFAEKLQNILQREAQFCFGEKYKKFKILYKIN